MEKWSELMGRIQAAVNELGSAPSKTQIAQVAEELVDQIKSREEFIKNRLGETVFGYLESFTRRSPRECGEALHAFILVPFQRWLVGLDINSFKILKSYDLSRDTEMDIMSKGLGTYLKAVGTEELKGFLLRKVREFVKNLSVLCKRVFPNLRAIMTPGGGIMVGYLIRAYVMGVVQTFMDPQQIPESTEEEEDELGVANMKILYRALAQAMTKYAVGSKVPTQDEIRTALEKRSEKEKQQFISEIDRMNRDQRKVELTMKSLGMGKWAAGGSKSIRQYDPERYEVERAERVAAGITDYTDAPPEHTDLFGADFGADYDAGGERMDGDYTEGAMREDEY
jgi:hypothetical protein